MLSKTSREVREISGLWLTGHSFCFSSCLISLAGTPTATTLAGISESENRRRRTGFTQISLPCSIRRPFNWGLEQKWVKVEREVILKWEPGFVHVQHERPPKWRPGFCARSTRTSPKMGLREVDSGEPFWILMKDLSRERSFNVRKFSTIRCLFADTFNLIWPLAQLFPTCQRFLLA